MRKKILQFIFIITSRYPKTVLFFAVLLTLFSLYFARSLYIETSFTSLLSSDSSAANLYKNVISDFGTFDYMLAIIETTEEKHSQDLFAVSDAFAEAINNKEYIRSVEYKTDPDLEDFFSKSSDIRKANLLTQYDWENIVRLLTPEKLVSRIHWLKNILNESLPSSVRERILSDPLNIADVFRKRLAYSSGPLRLNMRHGYFISSDEKTLLMIIKPIKPSTNLVFNNRLIPFLELCKKGVLENQGDLKNTVSIRFAGNYIESYNNARIIRRDILLTSIFSFMFVIGLFIAAFKRTSALFFVGLPLLLGLVWTIGIISAVIGYLTIVTFGFAAVLIGLGIDFAINLYNRFSEEVIKGAAPNSAMETALIQTGEGIFIGAITTSVSFYGMMLTNFKGFKEFGFIAGTGIICCVISMFFVLPTLLLLRVNKKNNPFTVQKLGSFRLARVTETISGYPRLIIAAGVLLTVYLGYHSLFIKFDKDIQNLKQIDNDYKKLLQHIEDKFIMSSSQVIAVVEDTTLQGALEKNDKLYTLLESSKDKFGIVSYNSLRTVLPSIQSQKEAHKRLGELNLKKLRRQLRETAKANNLNPDIFNQFLLRLYKIQYYANLDSYITLMLDSDTAFKKLVAQYVVHEGGEFQTITNIYPPKDIWDQRVPAEFISYFKNRIPGISFTGLAIVTEELQQIIQRNLVLVILIIIIVVLLILVVHFGSTRKAFFAVIPVVCSILWMLGTMQIMGIQFNFLNIIITPIIIALGIDDGIYILQRFYENDKRDLVEAVEHTGRAVVITSLTTMIGFGSLIFANSPGVSQIGVLMLLGIGYALLASLTLLPAILKIWGKEFSLDEFIKADDWD